MRIVPYLMVLALAGMACDQASGGGSDGPVAASDSGADATVDGAEASVDASADAAPDAGGCRGWDTLAGLSPAELHELLAVTDVVLINVHDSYVGVIGGTDASIPYTDVDAIETFVDHDHCAEIVLYCLSDSMSVTAGEELVRRGYVRVSYLEGGLTAWEAAGYPVEG